MKIVTLEAENVKAIRAIRMELDGSLVVIGGDNAQGKSSVLDAIEMALSGAKSIPDEPIRNGQKSGSVKLALSNGVTVVRTFSVKTGHKLKLVETATGNAATDDNGTPITQVQSYLNPLLGDLAFDPLEFSRMAPKDQLETLKRITGLDFAEIDKRRAQAFEERTNVKRDAKKLEGQLAGMRVVENPPVAEVSVAELAEEFRCATEHNRSREGTILETAQLEQDVESLEQQLKLAKKRLGDQMRGELVDAVDEGAIQAKIDGAESMNTDFRDSRARSLVEENLMAMTMQIDELTEAIHAAESEKAEQLESATLPIKGLAFGDDGVTFNDIAFSDIATSEQVKVSMAIGLAGHPELNIVLIDNGEALDLESLAVIGKMAEEADAQVIMARVSKGSECSVIIEDGEISST